MRRLTRGDTFNNAELEALVLLDIKAFRTYQVVRAAEEMLPALPHADDLEEPLDGADGPQRSSNMVCKQETSTWAQHSLHLGNRKPVVRNRAERERADNGVERRVGKRQCVGVSFVELDGITALTRLAAGDPEHCWAQVDPSESDLLRIEGQVQSGADAHLERFPRSP